jgi:hypothetical protein
MDTMTGMAEKEPPYDVALSFAGEDRRYVEQVADALKDAGIRVFYDDYEKVSLWGRDLYSHLDYVYRIASRYCVIFISKDYAKKVWTNHERASAQARALSENDEYVLPARFDDTEIAGIRPTIGYVDLKDKAPKELAKLIQEKLGPERLIPGFPNKVDRLLEALNHKGSNRKERNKEARDIAYSFYRAMGRMSNGERRVVAAILVHGCGAELPAGVHLSLNVLRRITGFPEVQLLDMLAAIRPLNFTTIVRDPLTINHKKVGELVPNDKDILLSFWSPHVPHSKQSTRVASLAVSCASEGFCEEHSIAIVTNLDFHQLYSLYSGPLTVAECDHPTK